MAALSNQFSTPLREYTTIDFDQTALVPTQEPIKGDWKCCSLNVCGRELRVESIDSVNCCENRCCCVARVGLAAAVLTADLTYTAFDNCHFCDGDTSLLCDCHPCCNHCIAWGETAAAPLVPSSPNSRRSLVLMILGLAILWTSVYGGRKLFDNQSSWGIPVMVIGQLLAVISISRLRLRCMRPMPSPFPASALPLEMKTQQEIANANQSNS